MQCISRCEHLCYIQIYKHLNGICVFLETQHWLMNGAVNIIMIYKVGGGIELFKAPKKALSQNVCVLSCWWLM